MILKVHHIFDDNKTSIMIEEIIPNSPEERATFYRAYFKIANEQMQIMEISPVVVEALINVSNKVKRLENRNSELNI
jgi:hypothetical protein